MSNVPKDLPGNSHMEKAAEPEKKVKKVVSGTVKKQKQGIGKRFINSMEGGDDTETIKTYLWWDILVPAAKDLISDMITGGVEMFLYGSTRGTRTKRVGGNSHVNYSRRPAAPVPVMGRQTAQPHNYNVQRRAMHNFDDIILDNRGDAEEVLTHLVELIDMYGIATVADLYDLVGITSEFTDNKYGWDSLSRATVARVRGGYALNLPRTMVIE